MDFQTLGHTLCDTRETQILTLEDAEKATKIRRRILEAFEAGDFNSLPELSAVQIRGFLRNYARYLGLDEDAVIAEFEAAAIEATRGTRRGLGAKSKPVPPPRSSLANPKKTTQTQPAPPSLVKKTTGQMRPVRVEAVPTPSQTMTGYGGDIPVERGSLLLTLIRLFAAVAAVGVIAFVTVSVLRPSAIQSLIGQTVGATALPNILGDIPPTITIAASPTLGEFVSLIPTETAVGFTGGVQVIIETTQRTWIRLTTDGVEQLASIVRPGTRLEYTASQTISVTASNAEGIDVTYNGVPQTSFGARGQEVTIVFGTGGFDLQTGSNFAPTDLESETPLPTPTDFGGALVAELTATSTPTLTITSDVTIEPAASATIDPNVPSLPTLSVGVSDVASLPTPLPLPGMPTRAVVQPSPAAADSSLDATAQALLTMPLPVAGAIGGGSAETADQSAAETQIAAIALNAANAQAAPTDPPLQALPTNSAPIDAVLPAAATSIPPTLESTATLILPSPTSILDLLPTTAAPPTLAPLIADSPTPANTDTPAPTNTARPSATATRTASLTPTATRTLPPTLTPTPIPTRTFTPSRTPTRTPTMTPSAILPPRVTPADATPTKRGA